MRILVIGGNGLLGSACLRLFNKTDGIKVVGTFRSKYDEKQFSHSADQHYFLSDILDYRNLSDLFEKLRPTVVINCVSVAKSIISEGKVSELIPIYSVVPHVLAELCMNYSSRLIHISSDGVFSGSKGNYLEEDVPDAIDLYGRSKLLGEVMYGDTITLRTSLIGHDIGGQNGLVNWLISQKGICSGFPKVIFSGFPVIFLAQIIRDNILPNPELKGIYHVASDPISKYDLLRLISDIYSIKVEIRPDYSININRSLNASKLNEATAFISPSWPELIRTMHDDFLNSINKEF